jgi:dGTPase
MGKNGRALKDFLFERMYRHDKVNRKTEQVQDVVRQLFAHYLAKPEALPAGWQAAEADQRTAARRVADYIAGMTDRFALEEVRKLPLDGTQRLKK